MDIFDTNDLSDLPGELIKELNLVTKVDIKLLALFHEAGGTLNLSALLVGYYRKYNKVRTRLYMNSTCYRLIKKELLSPTSGKGEYEMTGRGRDQWKHWESAQQTPKTCTHNTDVDKDGADD